MLDVPEKTILKSKTFWAAIVQFLMALVGWITGQIDLWALILDFVAMLGIIFYRSSIDANLKNFFNQFEWFKSKTVWAAVAASLALLGTFIAGEIELMPMVTGILTAIVGVFIRASNTPEPG